jgi:hypothetical protein
MAKRKKKKTRADKEAGATGAKETAQLAEKESTAHKLTEAQPKPKPKAKSKVDAKDDTKPKSKPKAKSKAKPKLNIPSVIESPLEHIDKPMDISKEIDIGKPDSEIIAEDLEATQTDDQTGDVTEAILESAAETERLAGETEGLQSEDEQTGIVAEAEDSDVAENLSLDAVNAQTDKLTDDVSESVVEAYDTTERATEKEDEFHAYKQADDPTEVDTESSDTEILTEGLDVPQTDDQAGDVTEAILEAAAETERLTEEAETLAGETEGLQAEDEETGIVVEAEDPDTAESLIQEAEETQTGELTDDVPESVDAENPKEKTDDTLTDNQAVEAVSEKTVTEDAAVDNKTVVDRIKKRLFGIFSIVRKSYGSTEEGIENHAETESLTEGTDDIHTDVQEEKAVGTVAEDPLTDKQVGDADEGVDEDLDAIESSVEKPDDTQIDNQVVYASEANIEGTDDEIQPAVYRDNKRSRTTKTGIIISVFIVTAAVILLIIASIERRSAKSALVQTNKVAESIKQMQGEALKNREQITHSQIESSELVIDSLLLTRNGLELERANSDEVEVKRIIDVFISDIDERITKIKGNIVLLRNKLKEAN